MYFLQNLHKNPLEKLKVLLIAALATKKVGAESKLVPRLTGVDSALFNFIIPERFLSF